MLVTDRPTRDARREGVSRSAERERNIARARFLSNLLPKRGVGAELGVFQGRFSRILLDVTEASQLHLVDPFYFFTPTWHWGDGNRSSIDALVAILLDFKPEIEVSRVLVHVADDRVVLKQFHDNYLDWAYIDSSHQYGHTVEELDILVNKVKPEGVIAGDDWRPDPSHRHHGVYKAVRERVATGEFELLDVDLPAYQWAIRRTRPDTLRG